MRNIAQNTFKQKKKKKRKGYRCRVAGLLDVDWRTERQATVHCHVDTTGYTHLRRQRNGVVCDISNVSMCRRVSSQSNRTSAYNRTGVDLTVVSPARSHRAAALLLGGVVWQNVIADVGAVQVVVALLPLLRRRNRRRHLWSSGRRHVGIWRKHGKYFFSSVKSDVQVLWEKQVFNLVKKK